MIDDTLQSPPQPFFLVGGGGIRINKNLTVKLEHFCSLEILVLDLKLRYEVQSSAITTYYISCQYQTLPLELCDLLFPSATQVKKTSYR